MLDAHGPHRMLGLFDAGAAFVSAHKSAFSPQHRGGEQGVPQRVLTRSNRRVKAPQSRISLALVVVFLVCGLWHGAAWTFILWGLIHGIAMVVQHNWDKFYRGLCRRDRKFVTFRKSTLYSLVAWGLTMTVFIVSMVPFRSPDIAATGDFFAAMFSSQGAGQIQMSGSLLLALAFVVLVHAVRAPVVAPAINLYNRVPAVIRGGVYGALTALILTMVPAGDGVFIYQGF